MSSFPASLRVFVCGFLLCVAPRVFGLSYLIDGGSVFSGHYDEWMFEYAPGLGWSSSIVAGDENDMWSSIRVYTADDATGYVKITFSVEGAFSFAPDSMVDDDWFDPTVHANFDHMDPPVLTSSLSFTMSSIPTTTTVPLAGSGAISTTFSVIATLGDEHEFHPLVTHVVFSSPQCYVVDPDKPAGFGMFAYAQVMVSPLRVDPVPDCATSSLLVALGCALVGFSRRRVFARA